MYKITQLSIFLENKRGNLYNTLDLLAANDINIRALSLADTTEFGILRLVVQDPIKAKKILEEHWYIVKNTPISLCIHSWKDWKSYSIIASRRFGQSYKHFNCL